MSKHLPRAEQQALIAAWRGGDLRARDRLVVGLLPLVRFRVRSLVKQKPIDDELREDLVSEGVVGLLLGLGRYDLARTDIAPFSFACHYVDLHIREAMIRLIPAVSFRNYMAWWRQPSRTLEAGESLEVARTGGDDGVALLPRLADESTPQLDDLLAEREDSRAAVLRVRAALEGETPTRIDLFLRRYAYGQTPDQIAEAFASTWPHWSRQQAREIPAQMLARLIDTLGGTRHPREVAELLADAHREAPDDAPPAPTAPAWVLLPAPAARPKRRR